MGRFADSALAALSEAELAEYERLMEVPDRDLLGWVTGEIEVPQAFDSALLRRLRDFHNHGKS
jgi:antitoxin CptB